MSNTVPLSDKIARRYAAWTGKRPFLTLALILPVIGLAGWYGSGIQIRSNMEDLFPESTPAVVAAKHARETLKSSSQMIVVFASSSAAADHKLATDFCDRVSKWPEVAAVQCRRDINFFRKNATLFLSVKELLEIEDDVREQIKRATEHDLVGDDLMAGLDDGPTPTALPAGVTATGTQSGADKGADGKAKRGSKVPTDDDLRQRFASNDIREWVETNGGEILGVKIFPTVLPSEVDESRRFGNKVEALLAELKPKSYAPDMSVIVSGDYTELAQEIDTIQKGLIVTSLAALVIISLVQVLHFRRLRSLILMSLPLLAGTALTLAFSRCAIGYLNMITAFIFSMLFGMGNDFNVYTLSRYLEERAAGHDPQTAVENTMAGLWGALGQAAATTTVAFFALVVLDFRGFSQFGLIAGVGVELSLFATLGLFPATIMALHRIRPDPAVAAKQAEGARWLGWFVGPKVARWTLVVGAAATAWGVWYARGYEFETDLRKLRSESVRTLQDETPEIVAQSRYRNYAEQGSSSPILLVTPSIEVAHQIHLQLERDQKKLTRLDKFVSIYTFVPEQQDQKIPIIQRIRQRLLAKIDLLKGQERIDADRALTMLPAKAFTPDDLPDFVRKRFLDKQDHVGRFVLMYANGNLAEAKAVQEVIDQLGTFSVNGAKLTSTAAFFILAEADAIVRKEGPIAVLLATLAVALVVLWYFRSWWLLLYSFVPLTASFVIFLGLARLCGIELNLFSVTTLPGVVGIGIDGVTHILHRYDEEGKHANVKKILQQIGGAAWIALIVTMVGFAALLFQNNPGLRSIAWMATLGLLISCLVSNILTGAILTVFPPRRQPVKDASASAAAQT